MYRDNSEGAGLIVLVGSGRWGHNEGDEPAYTQPLMYEIIKKTPPVREKYAAQLAAEGLLTPEEAQQEAEAAYAQLTEVQQPLKARSRSSGEQRGIVRATVAEPHTAGSHGLLTHLNEHQLTPPDG